LPPDDFWVSRNVYRPGVDQPPVYVKVHLSQAGVCSLKIYNSAGELVRVLLDEPLQYGTYRDINWDGLNKYNAPVASGVYVIYYTTRYQTRMARLLILR
jgi:flagellar hook assembly protein FlgD